MRKLFKRLYYRLFLKVPIYERHDYDTEPDGGFIDEWRIQ